MKRFGRLDIVVFANAGINGVWASIDELKPAEWNQTIRTNLRGTFLMIKYAVPNPKKSGQQGGDERRAWIIVMASVNGTPVFSNADATAYACTKAAQLAFIQMIALELAKDKIRVNAICPVVVGTNIDEHRAARCRQGEAGRKIWGHKPAALEQWLPRRSRQSCQAGAFSGVGCIAAY